tara:strand:+ start:2288 stop:2437 length:150 start_codon:yes stop_codon:yes gene_type:complete
MAEKSVKLDRVAMTAASENVANMLYSGLPNNLQSDRPPKRTIYEALLQK